MDAAGNAYVAGSTFDPKLPVTAGAYQTLSRMDGDPEFRGPAAERRIRAEAESVRTAVVWGSYLGGDAEDAATAATLDAAGNLWVAGTTARRSFRMRMGGRRVEDFIVEFNATGGLQLLGAISGRHDVADAGDRCGGAAAHGDGKRRGVGRDGGTEAGDAAVSGGPDGRADRGGRGDLDLWSASRGCGQRR